MNTDIQLSKMKRECNGYLISLIGENNVDEWWNKKNKAFLGATPHEVWQTDPKKVYQYLVTAGDGYW
jgi:hypothetical protein